MATCSLRFYKNSKLKVEKNWCFDSIETYLASLTYYDVSNYQYQRFELDKEIRVDFAQSEQTISPSANKYDYLRISTIVNNAPVYYYYFIIKTRQVSESTIAYQLRMDTLNTFKFSSTAANGNYTLSPKTLVKREHKDRFESGIIYKDKALKINRITKAYIDDPKINKKYAPNLPLTITHPWGTEEVFDVGVGTSTYETIYNIKHYNLSGRLLEEYNGHNVIKVTPYDDSIDFKGNELDDSEWYIESYPYNSYVVITFSKITSGTGINDLVDFFKFVFMRGDPAFYHKRIIDEFQEGLSTTLFKKNEITLYDEDEGNQWYVVYASANAVTSGASDTEAVYVNPVHVRFYSKDGYSISTASSHEVVLYATDNIIPKWNNSAEYLDYNPQPAPAAGTQYIKINGVTYDFHDYQNFRAKRTKNSDMFFSSVSIVNRGTLVTTTLSNVESITFFGINSIYCEDDWNQKSTYIDINSGAGTYSGSCDSWEELDITDSRLIKAFAFPYAPCEFLVGISTFSRLPDGVIFTADNVIEMSSAQTPLFNYTKEFSNVNPQKDLLYEFTEVITAGVSRNEVYESKLLHSDYHQPKLVYDSFSFPYYLEDIDINKYLDESNDFSILELNYVVSQNIQSKFMFGLPQYLLKKSRQDYDNVLCIERNNEKALFNNAYINYIKSGGYSYDTKKASSQNAVNGVTTALSIVGSVASFASSGATGGAGIAAGVGLAIGAAAGVIRSVHTAQEQDRAIAQKVMQAHMQGTSVQGSEDIDILTAFSGNKAKIVYYELSDIMKTAMWDLFYYCGYATHEQKIPDVTTRMYFNFVQAEVIFEEYNFNDEIADDIQNKWNEGVTFFHPVSGAYDINQEYENFETSLL